MVHYGQSHDKTEPVLNPILSKTPSYHISLYFFENHQQQKRKKKDSNVFTLLPFPYIFFFVDVCGLAISECLYGSISPFQKNAKKAHN